MALEQQLTIVVTAPSASRITQAMADAASNGTSQATFLSTSQYDPDPPLIGNDSMSYGHKASWDPLHQRIVQVGGLHGNPGTVQRLWLNRYVDASNGWLPADAVLDGLVSQETHGFHAACVDWQTGDVYTQLPYLGVNEIRRKKFSTDTWDAPLPSPNARSVQCCALAYHPNLYGGQGGLVFGSDTGIRTINLRNIAGGWTQILDKNNSVDAMGAFPVGCYCRKDDAVYMGGYGFSTLWKVNAHSGAGSLPTTIQGPSGTSLGTWDDGSNTTEICDAGQIAHGLLAITRDGSVREYNATTGAWSAQIFQLVSGLVNAPVHSWFPVAAYGKEGLVMTRLGNVSSPAGNIRGTVSPTQYTLYY